MYCLKPDVDIKEVFLLDTRCSQRFLTWMCDGSQLHVFILSILFYLESRNLDKRHSHTPKECAEGNAGFENILFLIYAGTLLAKCIFSYSWVTLTFPIHQVFFVYLLSKFNLTSIEQVSYFWRFCLEKLMNCGDSFHKRNINVSSQKTGSDLLSKGVDLLIALDFDGTSWNWSQSCFHVPTNQNQELHIFVV